MTEPPRESEAGLLFVYGTLRRGFPLHHHLRRLRAEFVAAGRVRAELFRVGQFIGARPSGNPGRSVAGELYRLPAVSSSLRVSDKVEGFSPRAPQRGVLHRAATEVTLPGGERRRAWVYWLSQRVHAPRRYAAG